MKKSIAPAQKIVSEGVHFECQGSGKCCVSHGEYGFVYLSLKDRASMARHFSLSIEEFTNKYCKNVDEFWVLKDNDGKPDCLFLKDKKCSVYKARPTQCRTWPFWPEVLSAKKWKKDVADFCPGVGKGKHYSWDEIKKISDNEAANNRSMFASALVLKD